jgi:hypothetical protein
VRGNEVTPRYDFSVDKVLAKCLQQYGGGGPIYRHFAGHRARAKA